MSFNLDPTFHKTPGTGVYETGGSIKRGYTIQTYAGVTQGLDRPCLYIYIYRLSTGDSL